MKKFLLTTFGCCLVFALVAQPKQIAKAAMLVSKSAALTIESKLDAGTQNVAEEKTKAALEKLQEAFEYATKTGDHNLLAKALQGITDIHIEQKDTGFWLSYTLARAKAAARRGDSQAAALWYNFAMQMSAENGMDAGPWLTRY